MNIHDWAKCRFHEGLREGVDPQIHSREVGDEMMRRLDTVMKHEHFDLGQKAWCYKCKQQCFVHCTGHVVSEECTTVSIAGTTCTSWSAMGKKGKWLATSALPFIVWAYETLAVQPDIIIHECTPRFDFGVMVGIFGLLYIVQSFTFTPVELGWPANRPRRWTICFHRRRRSPIVPLTRPSFGID